MQRALQEAGSVCVCGDGNEDGAGTTLKRTCMCMYVCTGSYTCLCPASANSGVRLCVVLFWNAVMGVNLMQEEGKAWSVDRHRRDHSLQCA